MDSQLARTLREHTAAVYDAVGYPRKRKRPESTEEPFRILAGQLRHPIRLIDDNGIERVRIG